MLATISQVNYMGNLTHRVKDLPAPQFIDLLEQITREFEHFLRAIDLINNEALETMLEQILEAFTLKIGQILQAERTTIFMLDEEKQQLWSKIAQGEGEKSLEIRIPVSVGIAGHVASTGECLNIPDAYSHPLFNKEVDKQTGYRTRNILCLPIFSSKKQVVAVVQLLNKVGQEPFDQSDERHFREFASSIGIILESCNSFYIAARNQKGVSALLKATSCLGQSLDLEKTLRVVMDEARDLMHADRSTLFLLDRDRNELWSKVAKADGKTMMEIRIPADKGIAGYVASTGQTLNIPNAYEDPRFDPSTDKRTGYYTRNILCMPVYNSAGTLIGVTQLINKNHGSFTQSDEEFMRAFNIQAGVALENAQLFENVLLEKQYQKDMLQSLSDAVISTDMAGKIVTINDAALELLGCPLEDEVGRVNRDLWEQQLVGRCVWDIVPIDKLRFRVEDSLENETKQYVPEQVLKVGVFIQTTAATDDPESEAVATYVLAIADPNHPDRYVPWNIAASADSSDSSESQEDEGGIALPNPISRDQIQELERSVNLTVNPLTTPEGGVRGGLVVLEDISQEKRMKTTLYRYMTPGVAERVMALGDDALMEGERKEVTILFSDIRGYTTLTENLEAVKVVRLLNEYFETMVEAVLDYEGTLDKFIGDALMAVFGAPLPLQNHAWAAVRSALDMRQRLMEFNSDRARQAQPRIQIGIGISSGEVVSGNIGSKQRMDYTVVGDGVNLSSRLEGVTKQYGCDIVISEFTYELCQEQLWVRELDRIRVKGKNEPVSVYDVLGDRQSSLSDDTLEFLELYKMGRAAYSSRNFEAAIRHFEIAQKLRPTDKAVAMHIARSRDYLTNLPPEGWDGVYTMTVK